MIKENKYNLFGSKKIAIPTPKFIVFYNGLKECPEVEEMHLSDAYTHEEEQYQLDLSCMVYNINPGMNPDLMKLSKVLDGYTAFVEKVRKYDKMNIPLQKAVERSLDECIEEHILAEFFTRHRVEVTKQAVLDFTFERQLELERRDSREDGYAEGFETGRQEGLETGRREGLETGHREGIEKGAEQFLVSLITDKLKVGLDIATIAKDLVQTKEHIEELIEKYQIKVG